MQSKLEALREGSVAQEEKLFVAFELSHGSGRLTLSDGVRVSEKVVVVTVRGRSK